jgi:1-acyl-sn-glycerol-3-phosphate acyltransferase
VLFGEPIALPAGKGRTGLVAATDAVRTELVELIAELDRLVADQHQDYSRGKEA